MVRREVAVEHRDGVASASSAAQGFLDRRVDQNTVKPRQQLGHSSAELNPAIAGGHNLVVVFQALPEDPPVSAERSK